MEEYFRKLDDHFTQYAGSEDALSVFDEITSPDFHLDVYWIKPSESRSYSILVTSGVSHKTIAVPDPQFPNRIELMMLLPEDWKLDGDNWKKPENYWPIRILKSLGRFVHSQNTWLGPGHTILETEQDAFYGTKFNSSLVANSISISSDFTTVDSEDGSIKIYAIIPLYPEELSLKKEKGVGKLYERFGKYGIDDFVLTSRKNVGKVGFFG